MYGSGGQGTVTASGTDWMAKGLWKFQWESVRCAFSCLGQPTSCEHAAPNQGWQGRWFIFDCLRIPALQREADTRFDSLSWAFQFPVHYKWHSRWRACLSVLSLEGGIFIPSCTHTRTICSCFFRSCWAPGKEELRWEPDHGFPALPSPVPHTPPCTS